MRKNSIKNTRINGEVQRELSRIISREIKDPRIAPMTSVVDAVVTSDLKQCKAYISVLGNNEEKEETMIEFKIVISDDEEREVIIKKLQKSLARIVYKESDLTSRFK